MCKWMHHLIVYKISPSKTRDLEISHGKYHLLWISPGSQESALLTVSVGDVGFNLGGGGGSHRCKTLSSAL